MLQNKPDAVVASMPVVQSRVARLSYGIQLGSVPSHVSPPIDRQRDVFYKDLDGEERVMRMKWHLQKVRRPQKSLDRE